MLTANQQEELDGNEKLLGRAEVWLDHVKRHRESGNNEAARGAAWEYLQTIRDCEKATLQLYNNISDGN
jgi:hypothetical protein